MLIALTGGIGSGKSTCLDLFQQLGANVADADIIVHQLYDQDQEMLQQIRQRWGDKVFMENGQANKQAIAGIIFFDKQERQWLNELIHPRVRRECEKMRQQPGLSIIAIPLLYETGKEKNYDAVISVWASPEEQRQRLRGRSWDEEQIDARLNSQLSQDEKLDRAQHAIINNFSRQVLEEQCATIYKRLLTEQGNVYE